MHEELSKYLATIGSLSSDVFERRTSTGREVFSLLTCLDDIKFVFLSFFTFIEAIWLKICGKPLSKNETRPLPVDVRRSKTLLLRLPVVENEQLRKHPHIFVNFDVFGPYGNMLIILRGPIKLSISAIKMVISKIGEDRSGTSLGKVWPILTELQTKK